MCGCLVTHPGAVFAGGINTRLSKDIGLEGIKHLICSILPIVSHFGKFQPVPNSLGSSFCG